jgi:hypothetical protein
MAKTEHSTTTRRAVLAGAVAQANGANVTRLQSRK